MIWWGFLLPMRRKRYALELFEQVALCAEERTRTDKDNTNRRHTYTVYPVRLEGQEWIELGAKENFQSARALAEKVAKYVELPLADSTSGKISLRATADLDKSLAEQLQQEGVVLELPQLPAETKLHVETGDGKVRIELPRRTGLGRSLVLWGPSAFALLGGAVIAWGLELDYSQAAILLLGLLLVAFLLGRLGLEQTIVHLDKGRLEVEQRALWTRRKFIERAELEELYQVYKALALSTGVDQSDQAKEQAMQSKASEDDLERIDTLGLSCRYILAVSDRIRIAIPVYSTREDAQFVHDMIQYGLGR